MKRNFMSNSFHSRSIVVLLSPRTGQKDVEDLKGSIRAFIRRRLPVVLTPREVLRLLDHLKGAPLLMSQLIYGAGMRLCECVRLRIKDIDFE